MSLLNLYNIKKIFKGNIVLDSINLEVEEGSCIHIYGKNGCGKSTLFKIVCDILKADEGIINKDKYTHLGALIENPGFIENESIKFNLKFLGSLKNNYDEQTVIELCNHYFLDYNNHAPIKSYSVGMRQKVGIIQAVMENQNLILFDEPTRGLDKDSIAVFENMVRSLIKEKKSVIIASHDILPNIPYSHKLLLENGRLLPQ